MDPEKDFVDFVMRLFACSPETAEAVAQRAARKVYAARDVVLRQGDHCSDTWLILAGRAQALVYGVDGQLAMVQEYADGDLFGAIAALDSKPQEADVVAAETLRAALFLGGDFLELIEAHSAVGLAVSRLLLRQLRAATGRMVERMTLTAPGRLRAELLRMAVDEGGRRVIRPIPVWAVLALRIHTARETVSREISKMERRGQVRREGGALVLLAPRAIEDDVF
ncbi:MAG: Crp/Fnr family transcriptional regulator [Caulobacter sp.]|jgi:CRP-like cAMP-binding protein|nr:Crp/Fnr family transcriptional regulator [Caulobacter sp.]